MRFIWLAVVILFMAAIVIFAMQNFQSVTVSFLGLSVNIRLAFLTVGIYALGAVSGAWLLAAFKHSLARSQAADLFTKRGQ